MDYGGQKEKDLSIFIEIFYSLGRYCIFLFLLLVLQMASSLRVKVFNKMKKEMEILLLFESIQISNKM